MTNSKVLVKNDKVIVTEWSFNVGDSTGTHKHQYNYVLGISLNVRQILKNSFFSKL